MVYKFFFFKQKTAYEMRISDWSSDVCSSDLVVGGWGQGCTLLVRRCPEPAGAATTSDNRGHGGRDQQRGGDRLERGDTGVAPDCEIGRASCRERVCQYV